MRQQIVVILAGTLAFGLGIGEAHADTLDEQAFMRQCLGGAQDCFYGTAPTRCVPSRPLGDFWAERWQIGGAATSANWKAKDCTTWGGECRRAVLEQLPDTRELARRMEVVLQRRRNYDSNGECSNELAMNPEIVRAVRGACERSKQDCIRETQSAFAQLEAILDIDQCMYVVEHKRRLQMVYDQRRAACVARFNEELQKRQAAEARRREEEERRRQLAEQRRQQQEEELRRRQEAEAQRREQQPRTRAPSPAEPQPSSSPPASNTASEAPAPAPTTACTRTVGMGEITLRVCDGQFIVRNGGVRVRFELVIYSKEGSSWGTRVYAAPLTLEPQEERHVPCERCATSTYLKSFVNYLRNPEGVDDEEPPSGRVDPQQVQREKIARERAEREEREQHRRAEVAETARRTDERRTALMEGTAKMMADIDAKAGAIKVSEGRRDGEFDLAPAVGVLTLGDTYAAAAAFYLSVRHTFRFRGEPDEVPPGIEVIGRAHGYGGYGPTNPENGNADTVTFGLVDLGAHFMTPRLGIGLWVAGGGGSATDDEGETYAVTLPRWGVMATVQPMTSRKNTFELSGRLARGYWEGALAFGFEGRHMFLRFNGGSGTDLDRDGDRHGATWLFAMTAGFGMRLPW